MNPSVKPLWRKSMLCRLNLDSITYDLEEISENGDCCGYDYQSQSDKYGYYSEYAELFNELSLGAYNLWETLRGDFGNYEKISESWDDMTVGLLGDTMTVYGFDAGEQDYAKFDDSYMEKCAQEECLKRIERYTKHDLIGRFRMVLGILMSYVDIKNGYDALSATVAELEYRAALFEKKTDAINKIYEDYIGEDIYSKDTTEFDRIVAGLPQRMWLE